MKHIPEGGTLGDAFTAFRKATGKPHPQDRERITPPETLLYLYGWFWECATGRPMGPEGIALPIPATEIRAWAELNDRRLHSWELLALRALDSAFLKVGAEKGV